MSVITTIAAVTASIAAVSVAAYAHKKKMDAVPMTFDRFIQINSKKNDNYIILKSAELKMKYQGGKCTISFPEDDLIHSESKLYFKGKNDNNWKETTLVFDIPVSQFANDADTQEKLNNLKTEPLVFEIQPE